jgi:tetratricopeptide (TPR) repeat protein
MSYSGNPSLSSDVKQRILSTFDQTVELAREGNRQEALLGCDFVLRMDPQFQPAQVLQERLRSGDGPTPVDDLRSTPEAPLEDPFGDLDSLSLDLPEQLPDDSIAYLRDELQTLLEQRRFQDLLAAAEREQSTIALHPELRRIVGTAQERLEAEPYVLKFLESARQALKSGQDDEAGRLLDKARALDPEHPGIAVLERTLSASAAPPPTLAIPPPLQSGAVPTSLAWGGGDSESDRRIQELLAEGQTAFDAGDPQSAIDSWSRIFLIDIDHQEASRRIEAARKLKAESERQVEEIFHDGLSRLEAGDAEGARQAFQRVLELQPAYFTAREYLQQLDAGTVPAPKAAAAREGPAAVEPARSLAADASISGQELKEEILVPPEPGEEPAAAPERPARRMAASRDSSRARRLFVILGGAVLALALAGGWFAYQNRERLFPNSQEAAPVALSQDPIARAERLHKAGKTAIALNQLRRIPPADPRYPRAQKLIAQWGGTPRTTAPVSPSPAPTAPPALTPEAERRQALLAAARDAYSEGSHLKTLRRLEQAGRIAKLEGEDAILLVDVKRKLEPLAKQIEFFREHEWESILRDLWIKHDADPGNRDVTQLLADSNYNLAVRDLQRNDASKAVTWLSDAVKLQPDDAVLRRHYLFAQTYQERPKDLLYQIYVKYLPYR